MLYNRRHFGVAFFFVVLLHAIVAFGFYGGFGVRDHPWVHYVPLAWQPSIYRRMVRARHRLP